MEMLLRLCCVTLVIVTHWNFVDTLSHTQTLMWCQKQSFFGPVGIVGIQGSPDVWMSRGYFQAVSSGAPVDLVSRYQSHRIALAYRYSTHNLFWSDRGLKNIYRVELEQHAPGVYHNYTAQLTRVYHGSSSQVNGIAVDWLSGAIYWTDALYNWISVAASGQDGRVDNLYRRLWVTGLDRPHGIAVHPMRGWLFWNDWGSVPKIERSTLHGTERTTLIDTALNRPQGMTIDFEHDRLYWVDDYRDTVNYMALDGGRRSHFNVHQNNNGLGHLFGIALSENFVFVTDQLDPSIKIYHKHDETFLGMIALHNSVPYDILMYDEKHQPIDGQTPCSQMNCEHFCVSTADGTGQCICSEGFDLQDSTCVENDYLHQPAYIYSASHAICSSPIHLADRTVPIADDIDCFIDDVEEVMALGYDAHADLLFYSDDSRRDIRRHRQVAGDEAQVLAVQTGHVRGLSVDWLVGNLFYTDADAGTINVMNTDGRYPTTLMEGLSNPRSLAVNPLQGKMYWSSPDHDSIRWANMDGTEHLQFADNCVQPDGLALLPQADKQRLYWVEDSQEYNIGGIMSKKLDGTDLKLERRWRNNLFRDLAIFNDYMVWTDGYGNVIFAEQGQEPRRGLTHSPHKSHDIIAYSDVNQPLGISKCDSEYGGCSQLCIPMPDEQRVCKCTYGYYLAADEMTCISDLTDTNFILFVDPYHKNLYQLDFDLKETGSPRLHSRALRTAEFPHKFAFNPHDGMIFWIDRYSHVIKSSSLITEKESIVYTLSEAAHVGAMAYTIDTDVNWLFFSDQFTKTINYIDIVNNGTAPVLYAAEVDVDEMVVDEADSMIYWTHRASTGDTGGIYKGRLSGSSQGLVHPEIDQITSLALDRSNDRLIYCTSTTVYAISKRGDLVELLLEQPNATFSNIVVLKDDLYVTMTEERQVYRLRATNGWVQETVSDPIFSRITDMKADVATSVHFTIEGYTTPTTPAASTTPAAFTGTTEKLGVFDRHIKLIAISAAGGFLLLLIICIILVCCLCRTKTEEKKKPPPSDAERNAHDNPTYATTVIAEEPIYSTVGALQASGGRDPDLPDLVSDSEEKKVPLDASQQKNTTDGSTNSGYVVDPDDEQLVEPEEVTVHIDSSSGPKVKFQNSRED